MPHGVLFRGGKEKLIRELLIEDDVIEAIISLPPGLFYGTGIPACVIICNKQTPEALRNKVLFINADREFAEGKNQNKLRPEDTEKIDYAQLRTGKTMPEVRQELLTTLKEKLIPLSALDEFKSAGVFVNWWQQIRFDLKTIMATGWHHTLIPDDYLIAAFCKAEADAIEALEATASEKQSELAEAVEAGQEL